MNINNNVLSDDSINERLQNMPRERAEKVRAYKFLDDRKRSFCAGLLVQAVLGEQVNIQADKYGKPFAKGCPHFSISHSGEWVLLALCETPVGIDIEKTRSYSQDKMLAMAKHFLHPAEIETINAAPDRLARQSLFIKYWVLKESYLKMKGTGFFANVSLVHCLFDCHNVQTAFVENEPGIKLTLYDVSGTSTHYNAAVCSSTHVIWPSEIQVLDAACFLGAAS